MKNFIKHTSLFLLLMVCTAGFNVLAYGQMVQGEVTEVDPGGTFLRIARTDPESRAAEPESIKVQVSPATVYEELGTIEELRAGDEVWADITQDEKTKIWVASKIRLDKVDIQSPGDAEAEQEASQSEIVL